MSRPLSLLLLMTAFSCSAPIAQKGIARTERLLPGWTEVFHAEPDGRVRLQTYTSGDGRASIEVVAGSPNMSGIWKRVMEECDEDHSVGEEQCRYAPKTATLLIIGRHPQSSIQMRAHVAFKDMGQNLVSIYGRWTHDMRGEAKQSFERVLSFVSSQ